MQLVASASRHPTPSPASTTTHPACCPHSLSSRCCFGQQSSKHVPHRTAARQRSGRQITTNASRPAGPSSNSSSSSRARATHTQQQQSVGMRSLASQMLADPPMWRPFLGVLALSGAVLGTALDGIHSRVGLQVYDLAPITVGPLTTSLLVPPLLATFYVVLGLLTCIADNMLPGPSTAAAQQRAGQDVQAYLVPCFGVLASNLYCSASLFDAQVAPGQIFAVLAALALVNWWTFDRTKQGLGLAVLCGLGAPAAELVLMAASGCWHYSRPDVAGVFVSWVPLCYAFYVPAVSNLARYLWQSCRPAKQ